MGGNILGLSFPSPCSAGIRLFTSPPSRFSANSNLSSFHGARLLQHFSLSARRVPSFCKPSSATTVMMAKREEELKEIRAKTTEEINEDIVELKGEIFVLHLKKSTKKEFISSEFRRMRKRVARMLTVRRERELEEGINKRLSRKLDRKWKKSIVIKPPPGLIKLQEEEKAEAAAAEAEKST